MKKIARISIKTNFIRHLIDEEHGRTVVQNPLDRSSGMMSELKFEKA